MTYRQMGPMGARIGAFFLDQIFLTLILCASIPYGLFPLLAVMGNLLYFGFFEGSGLHASLGKRLCGLIVVDRDGVPLDLGRAFLRALCRILSGAILGIGFLIGLLDREGKALHDQLAGTFVALRSTPGHTGTPQFHRPQPEKGEETVLHPQIIGISGQFAGQAFPVSTHGVMLGRDPSSCDFVFPANAQGISRNHCKLQFNPQTQMFVLYDLGSSFGTYLGSGIQVPQGQPAALRAGDEFYLATRANVFRVSL